ncbi:MAG: hypothetical protein HY329_13510 [Chloroflexi bacterium]|nr:hypothetical protein [Chloroflexota bacterium]
MHRHTTEAQLMGGGLLLIALLGTAILWLTFGRETALLGLAVMVGGVLLLGGLLLLLRALEEWAKRE